MKWQIEPEMAYDPSKIHEIIYKGKYHTIKSLHATHPSRQRTPVLFQAGASKSGIAFGGKHAEGIFCAHTNVADAKEYSASVRAAAVAEGRDPESIKIFQGAMVFLGSTAEEAQAKYERAKKFSSVEGGLARLSSFINVDMSKYPLDEPFNLEGDIKENAIQGVVNQLKSISGKETLTPRDVGEMMVLGGMGPQAIGTPAMVADELIRWAQEGDLDGFNLSGEHACFYPNFHIGNQQTAKGL